MAIILSIETSSKNCSVCLSKDGETLMLKEAQSDQYIHSEKLHVFIEEAVKESKLTFDQIEAVAVTKGPGSYTGLRIGVSAAKGLCFSLQIPLIAVDSLKVLAHQFLIQSNIDSTDLVIPMIDARRMEVYCAVYNSDGDITRPIEAKIIEENSFENILASKIHLLGDGALKTKDILGTEKFEYHNMDYPSAQTLSLLASEKMKNNDFEDVAYFEPYYLKNFVAGKPKKLL